MSKYNPNIHHRRSIRLKGYDYSQAGMYFITICVQNRECLFGEITDGVLILNDAGQMVEKQWLDIKNRFPNIELHEYVVMPNHFHAILEIVGEPLVGTHKTVTRNEPTSHNTNTPNESGSHNKTVTPNNPVSGNESIDVNEKRRQHGQTPTEIKTKTVGEMVGAFQSIVTVEYIRGVKNKNWTPFDRKLWQRNYWEHIIRNDKSYHNISNYIINNPAKWQEDKLNAQ